MVTLFDNKYKVNFGRLSTELDDLKFRVMNHDVEILAYYIESKNLVERYTKGKLASSLEGFGDIQGRSRPSNFKRCSKSLAFSFRNPAFDL